VTRRAATAWMPDRQDIIWIDCNPFAVVAGIAGSAKAGKTSYVLCHQPKSFDWRARQASPHPMKALNDAAFAQVRAVLNQIMALA
jgi:mRNA interferase MazF